MKKHKMIKLQHNVVTCKWFLQGIFKNVKADRKKHLLLDQQGVLIKLPYRCQNYLTFDLKKCKLTFRYW